MENISEQINSCTPVELYRRITQTFETVWKDSNDESSWVEYDPDALLLSLLPEDADQEAKDKICAVQALCYDPERACAFAHAFENMINAFNGNALVMDQMQPPYLEELFYGVQQIKQIVMAHTGKEPNWSGEVPGYVAALAKHHGVAVLPKPLAFAQEMLDSLTGKHIGSKKREEYSKLLEALNSLASELDKAQYAKEDLDAAVGILGASEGAYTNCVMAILRCYAYDFQRGTK